jgi:hypothetical protein
MSQAHQTWYLAQGLTLGTPAPPNLTYLALLEVYLSPHEIQTGSISSWLFSNWLLRDSVSFHLIAVLSLIQGFWGHQVCTKTEEEERHGDLMGKVLSGSDLDMVNSLPTLQGLELSHLAMAASKARR